MNRKAHNQIVSYIWTIADDVLRDVFVRGKYRDVILPFTVLRRLDVLLEASKGKVLKTNAFLDENKIDNKGTLTSITDYPFYNTSNFTMGKNCKEDAPENEKFTALASDPDNIDENLGKYLDGFSPNVQEIISKFKIRNQLETMKEAGITLLLLQKLTASEINIGSEEKVNSKGEILPALTNLGMGYVFEELIRKFNEENNEEAGEHFTPREIIRLMTHLIFEPIKGQTKEFSTFSIYDPACGSGGMLTEAEKFATKITGGKSKFHLFGQEVNPETYAICTSDMLIKLKEVKNIAYGSTLGKDGFPMKRFDFMLSNPPYGKSWKIDYDAIVGDKKRILDNRFLQGVPRSSDGQLLFLMNMVSKMKTTTDLGSRIASVHNGSALFTGDAGSGESEIRRYLIENDYLDCIIGLPKNMFYNTGINTYIFVLTNRKPEHRKGKVQLIDATDVFQKMRKSLGAKSHEMTKEQIEYLTKVYMDFKSTDISKIFDNQDLGYYKITVNRPLRLATQMTDERLETLRFNNNLSEEMQWIYEKYGDKVYEDLKAAEKPILKHFETEGIKIKNADKKKLLNPTFWQQQRQIMETAQQLQTILGDAISMDFNTFKTAFDKTLKKLKIKLSATDKKTILKAITWTDEAAEKVIAKKEKNGTIHYEADSSLRDTENVPLKDDITAYFNREVLPHVPDAWIDDSKTLIGYEISFTKYFYHYQPLRSLEAITNDLLAVETQSEGLLKAILK